MSSLIDATCRDLSRQVSRIRTEVRAANSRLLERKQAHADAKRRSDEKALAYEQQIAAYQERLAEVENTLSLFTAQRILEKRLERVHHRLEELTRPDKRLKKGRAAVVQHRTDVNQLVWCRDELECRLEHIETLLAQEVEESLNALNSARKAANRASHSLAKRVDEVKRAEQLLQKLQREAATLQEELARHQEELARQLSEHELEWKALARQGGVPDEHLDEITYELESESGPLHVTFGGPPGDPFGEGHAHYVIDLPTGAVRYRRGVNQPHGSHNHMPVSARAA